MSLQALRVEETALAFKAKLLEKQLAETRRNLSLVRQKIGFKLVGQ